MFTGIIESQATITHIHEWTITVTCDFVDELHIGQSVAHDGACMTITELHQDGYSFFAMQESFDKTNYWTKKVGDRFNIERCMQVSDRLDGHFVTGHIDCIWTVTTLEKGDDASLLVWISFDTQYDIYTTNKWSIAINWISLTVVDTAPWYLSVRIIPHTQQETNIWNLHLQDTVNLEFDLLAKYIHKQTTHTP